MSRSPSEPLASNQSAYEPPPQAMQAAAPIVRAIFESNGNPKLMTLDEHQIQRIAAFAVDSVVKAIRGEW